MNIPLPSFIQDKVDRGALIKGLAATLVIYALFFTVTGLGLNKKFAALKEKLAAETVLISSGHAPSSVTTTATAHHAAPAATSAHEPPRNDAAPHEEAEHGAPAAEHHNVNPFETNRRPFTRSGMPLIVIAVQDYGLSSAYSDALLEGLPPDVTLILSPYSDQIGPFKTKARSAGHELWLGLPVENQDYPVTDPGPQALQSQDGLQKNQQRLDWILSRTNGYAGVAASMDESFKNAPTVIQKVFGSILEKGLGFFDINPAAGSSIETMAVVQKAPYVRNKFLVESSSFKSIENQARQKGFAVAVIPPYPGNISALKIWLGTLESKGLTLAPLSAIAEQTMQ